MQTLDRIRACGVLPVVEIPDGTDPIVLVDALLGARIDAIEITLRTASAIDAIRAIRSARPDVLVVAGTVLSHALEHGVDIMPGVSTPTEVEIGLARGLGTFKFFPAEAAGGRRWLAAVGGPYPQIRFVPTGGIDAATLPGYLELPNVLACGGSWLVNRRLLENGNMETVRRLAQEARIIVNRVRPRADLSAVAQGR